MSQQSILLNLPRDLGDCLLSLPAIQTLQAYCTSNNIGLIAIGGKRQQEWIEAMGDMKLNRLEAADAAQQKSNTRCLINMNFYDNAAIEQYFYDVPLYQPERMITLEHDTAQYGKGAVVGKKHISQLLEDCLKDAGILKPSEKLSAPVLPASFTAQNNIDAVKTKFCISGRYAILIPVCAADRPFKRWEKEKFTAVAQDLAARGIQPVLIGGPAADEKQLCADIAAESAAIDACGQTSLSEIAALAAGAQFTLGNDTGPSHIAACSGAPTFVFFGYYNDPATWSPARNNPNAHVIQGPTIQSLQVSDVLQAIDAATAAPKSGPSFKNAA